VEDGGVYVAGGSASGFFGAGWWRIGYRFASGDSLDVLLASHRRATIAHTHNLHETECFRAAVVSGTHGGGIIECYLGQGFAVRLDLGTVPCPRLVLIHYPIEGVQLGIGFDLLRLTPCHEWALIF
jgi:hypothetical protein